MYYKIIQNDKVIDIVKNPDFIKFLPFNHIAITDKSSAQGIVGSDGTLYSFTPQRSDIQIAAIKEISREELSRLQNLLSSGQEISADETALEQAKQTMIKRLSNICKNKIVSGFSIKLSDGEYYNFKLTTEDQLNLMMLEQQLNTGIETFIYHATNQPCKIFTKADMQIIIETFRRHILYHTTYFNAVKQYIKSLSDIEKINLFIYGTDISDTVEDEVLRKLLKAGEIS